MTSRKLRREIEKELSFLFTDFGAHFVPEAAVKNGLTTETLATNNLRIRICTGRGEYGVLVSPSAGNHEWTDLRDAVRVVENKKSGREPVPFTSLAEIKAILQPWFAKLEDSFASEHYGSIKARVKQIKADDIANMKREVTATLTERARQTAVVRQVLAEFDSRFEPAEAERINALFEVFSEYRWNQDQEDKLRAGLNEVLLPRLGRAKAIEVMHRLMKMRGTS